MDEAEAEAPRARVLLDSTRGTPSGTDSKAAPAGAARLRGAACGGGSSSSHGRGGGGAGPRAVQLSLRLERQGLTDAEAAMLADWCQRLAGTVHVAALWLFDNRLTDAGAAHVARIVRCLPGMLELHLSHNLLTARGAGEVLAAIPVAAPAAAKPGPAAEPAAAEEAALPPPPPAPAPAKPLWLRLEWNRISVDSLCQLLEGQHAQRGLLVDLPAALRAEAAPALPAEALPGYLAEAAAALVQAPTPAPPPGCRSARNSLQYLLESCHARLPWVTCQYQLPSEAAVLNNARSSWQQQRQAGQAQASQRRQWLPQQPQQPAGGEGGEQLGSGLAIPPATPSTPNRAASQEQPSAGPLLLVPDTSALLAMLGAGTNVAQATSFTMELLAGLAGGGRMGRALPTHEQVGRCCVPLVTWGAMPRGNCLSRLSWLS